MAGVLDAIDSQVGRIFGEAVQIRRGQRPVLHAPQHAGGRAYLRHGPVRGRRAEAAGAVIGEHRRQRAGDLPRRAVAPVVFRGHQSFGNRPCRDPARELACVVREQAFLGPGVEEVGHVAAGLDLRRVFAQEAGEQGGVRGVEDNQPIDGFGVGGRRRPGHDAAPVVADEDHAFVAQGAHRPRRVAHKAVQPVGGEARGLVGQVVAAHVRRRGAPARPEFLRDEAQLAPPRIPELREPVEKQHEPPVGAARLRRRFDDMQAHVARVDIAVVKQRVAQRGGGGRRGGAGRGVGHGGGSRRKGRQWGGSCRMDAGPARANAPGAIVSFPFRARRL